MSEKPANLPNKTARKPKPPTAAEIAADAIIFQAHRNLNDADSCNGPTSMLPRQWESLTPGQRWGCKLALLRLARSQIAAAEKFLRARK